MSEPTLCLVDRDKFTEVLHMASCVMDCVLPWDHWYAYADAILETATMPVKPDYEAMAAVMNEEGWTCDGHEPGAWCEDCKRLQLGLVGKVWCAGIGGDDE